MEIHTESQQIPVIEHQIQSSSPTEPPSTPKSPKVGYAILVSLIIVGVFAAVFANAVYKVTMQRLALNQAESVRLELATSQPELTASSDPLPQLPQASQSDAQGKLAFVSGMEIWTIQSDGSELEQQTKDEYDKFFLVASPDGKKIAYAFHPKDEEKRIDLGLFEPYANGLAVLDLTTKESKVLIPYGPNQYEYPQWSPDGRLISLWVGDGKGAQLIDSDTGEVTMKVESGDDRATSPIVWIPSSDRVSFVDKSNLITSNINGSERQILASGVDALRIQFEAPNIPEPPLWSPSGKFVTFYTDNAFHLLDVVDKTDQLIAEGGFDDSYIEWYFPTAFLLGFNADETKMYMLKEGAQVRDLETGQTKTLADASDSSIYSPDGKYIFGSESASTYRHTKINLSDESVQKCSGDFQYTRNSWSGGTLLSGALITWSADSKGIIGYRDYGSDGLVILNVKDCSVFNLLSDKVVSSSSAIWLP